MRKLRAGLLAGVLAGGTLAAMTLTGLASTSQAAPSGGALGAAPYLYFGWGSPPSPTTVMSASGVRAFTLAFILSNGTCNPQWDGSRSLTGSDQTKINSIRNAGGDVVPSFGGWSGNKLGESCGSVSALAGAYQKVINAYKLKAIDIDIENTEFSTNSVQDRVLGAVKTIKQNNSGLKVFVTMPVEQNGLESHGQRLVKQAVKLGAPVDVWSVMPFDFGGGSGNMATLTTNAVQAVHNQLKSYYSGRSDAQIYAMQGISSMNGKTDDGETVTLANFKTIQSWANQHHLGRFTFWSANRDRPCGSGSDADSCGGISQKAWDFSKVVAGFTG
jgi:chitinase